MDSFSKRKKTILKTILISALVIAGIGIFWHFYSQENEYKIEKVGWRREIPILEYQRHYRHSKPGTRISHTWDHVDLLYTEEEGKDESKMYWPRTYVPENNGAVVGNKKQGTREQLFWVSYTNDKGETVERYFDSAELFEKAESGKIAVVNGFGQIKQIKD